MQWGRIKMPCRIYYRIKVRNMALSRWVTGWHFIVDIVGRVYTNDSRSKCPNGECTRLKSGHWWRIRINWVRKCAFKPIPPALGDTLLYSLRVNLRVAKFCTKLKTAVVATNNCQWANQPVDVGRSRRTEVVTTELKRSEWISYKKWREKACLRWQLVVTVSQRIESLPKQLMVTISEVCWFLQDMLVSGRPWL